MRPPDAASTCHTLGGSPRWKLRCSEDIIFSLGIRITSPESIWGITTAPGLLQTQIDDYGDC